MITNKIVFGVLLSISSVAVFGQGFQVNLQGQKQIGMAGAGVGLALDEASVFYNPGAVSMLDKNAISAGISPVFFKSAFLQRGSNHVEYNKDEVATPIQVYGVWGPKSGKYKLGLGVYTPFGGLNNWGEDWSGKYAITSLDLKAIYIQPTISIKLSDNIGFGAGFVFNHGIVDLRRRVPVSNDQGVPGSVQLKGNGNAYGWNAGLFMKSDFGLTAGISYRSKVVTKVEDGDANFDVASSLQPTFPTKFSSELPLPGTLALGLGYEAGPKTQLALDLSWTDWKVYENLAFTYNNNFETPPSPRNYGDGYAVKLGMQHMASEKFAIRAGAGYVFSPVKEGYVTPEVPDANRLILTAGMSYNFSRKFGVDISFMYENLKEIDETNIETQLSGKFKSHVYIPGISLAYRW